MAEVPIDLQTLKDLPQGAMETLLNTTRAETGAAVAFVALYRADGSFAITTSMEEDAPWEGRSLATLARSIWLDPDLTEGKVLVSSARVEGGRRKRRQAHVASVVLSDAAVSDLEWGLLSIIAQNDHELTEDQWERIGALSKNLAAYLSARERMIDDLMEAAHEEGTIPETMPTAETEGSSAPEDMFINTVRDDVSSTPRSRSIKAELRSEVVDNAELIRTPHSRVDNAEALSEFDVLATRARNNGVRDTPVRRVIEEPDDEIHIIPARSRDPGQETELRPKVVAHEDASTEPTPSAIEEPAAPNLTINVTEPGLVSNIGDAMDAIGISAESVALIQLRITYEDTSAVVPTEAARVLVARSIKDCVRYDDDVARVGENSFVIVARQRPGSPGPSALESRLLSEVRRATGWTGTGLDFRTGHLVIDPDNIDDPEDMLFALLHS